VLYIGSILLLLAYVGSRFVLEVILGAPHEVPPDRHPAAGRLVRLARARARARHAAPAPPPAPALPQEMVRCPVCSLHLPRNDALPGASGRLYCSHEHRSTGGN
jgi:uncharacterized protein